MEPATSHIKDNGCGWLHLHYIFYGHQQPHIASERLLSSTGNAVVKYDSKT
jgi:hypothetical protein